MVSVVIRRLYLASAKTGNQIEITVQAQAYRSSVQIMPSHVRKSHEQNNYSIWVLLHFPLRCRLVAAPFIVRCRVVCRSLLRRLPFVVPLLHK